MKTLFTLLLVCSFTLLKSQQFNILFSEKLLVSEDLMLAGIPSDKLTQMKKGFEGTTYYFKLSINKDYSNYTFAEKKITIPGAAPLKLTLMNVYKSRKENTAYRTPTKSDQSVFMQQTLYQLSDWDIQMNQTDVIIGYKVTKAILKSDPTIIAWFCPQIPLNDGPDIYSGLPGLILKVEGNHKKWEVLEVNMSTDNQLNLVWPQKIEILSKKDWNSWLEKNRSAFLVE